MLTIVIPKSKGNEILYDGKYYPMGIPIEVDFSTALRMNRSMGAALPYVHGEYDPSLWRDKKRATMIADIDGVSGWGNVGTNLIKYSRFAKFSLVGRVNKVRESSVAAAYSRPVEPESAALWHEQPKAEWLMSPFGRNIAIVPFETTQVPPSWIQRLNFMDAVFVPCAQNVQMMKDSGVTVPVELVHWGVDVEKFHEIERKDDGVFTFGTMGHLSYRKGTNILVNAFERAFPDEKDVRLICKTSNPHYNFMSKDKRIEVQMGEATHEDLMKDFFGRTDCFVFPTLGEGFGLPPLEAMSTGIPAIVTGWSGPVEYMIPEVGWTIDYSMAEAKGFSDEIMGVYKEPCGEWAQPSAHHLVELMRYAYENQEETRKKGIFAAKYVRENWKWQDQIGLFEQALNRHL